MATLDFRSIANKGLEDIQRPKNAPVGSYIWAVTKVPVIETLPGDLWDTVDFPLKCIAPTEDVDPDSLREWGGDISKLRLRHRFMFNKSDPIEFEKSEWRLKDFLENHVKCWQDGMSLNEAMNASINGQFIGQLNWNMDKKDDTIFHMNIGKTGPIV